MSARQEIADGSRDFGGVGFQREMAGVEEAYRGVWNIALERFGAGRKEERIILAPYRQERRLVATEIVLEGRIERDVTLVVAEQIELHLIGAGSRQIEVVKRIAVRRNLGRIGYAVGVLPDRRLRLEEGAQRLAVLL